MVGHSLVYAVEIFFPLKAKGRSTEGSSKAPFLVVQPRHRHGRCKTPGHKQSSSRGCAVCLSHNPQCNKCARARQVGQHLCPPGKGTTCFPFHCELGEEKSQEFCLLAFTGETPWKFLGVSAKKPTKQKLESPGSNCRSNSPCQPARATRFSGLFSILE